MVTAVAQQPLDVVILGDSNTWIGGDDCDKLAGWNTWFKDAFQPRSCKSYARSGATWTNTPATRRNTLENIGVLGNDNVIYNQICRLHEAVDSGLQPAPQLIMILAGTNDAWFQKARPRVFAMTPQEAFAADSTFTSLPVSQIVTLAASVRYGCELLREAYPEARVILLTPFQTVAASVADIVTTGDIIEGCARQMHLSVIRLDQLSGISAAHEKVRRRYTTDGTHTSVMGARQVGNLVARQVSALLSR